MYTDRHDAALALVSELEKLKLDRPVVLALPRGGVPVALPIARALGAPLDLILVRKIGAPGQPELAAGAMVDGPPEQVFLNQRIMEALRLTRADLMQVIQTKREELAARRETYLADRAPVDVTGRSVILVDDGIATGATVRAALLALKERDPAEIILAVPVAARDTLDILTPLVTRVVCPLVPEYFRAVGLHYKRFEQVPDSAVAEMMARAPVDTD